MGPTISCDYDLEYFKLVDQIQFLEKWFALYVSITVITFVIFIFTCDQLGFYYFCSPNEKYRQLQSNFRYHAEKLASIEFKIEFSHIEEGTPIPPSFPTRCTYWRDGGWSGVNAVTIPEQQPIAISSNPLKNGKIGTSPKLLNISEELEERLVCPITLEVMFDPWIDNEGNTYEYSAIIDHLSRSQTSPITRKPMFLTEAYLRPNRPIQDIIKLYTKQSKTSVTHTKKK